MAYSHGRDSEGERNTKQWQCPGLGVEARKASRFVPGGVIVRDVKPQDTERLEEFFVRKLKEGGHRLPVNAPYRPKHKADTDDALLAVSVPGRHKADEFEQALALCNVMKEVAAKTGKAVILETDKTPAILEAVRNYG